MSTESPGDYRITVRARNARILRLIERAGYSTLIAFAKATGVNYGRLNQFIGIRDSARLKANGEWKPFVYSLSAALGVEPEELFTERQAQGGMKPVEREMQEADVIALADLRGDIAMLETPETIMQRTEQREALEAAMKTLSAHEQLVFRRRMEGATLEEIAQEINVNRERVRQIEAKAERSLRVRIKGAACAAGERTGA